MIELPAIYVDVETATDRNATVATVTFHMFSQSFDVFLQEAASSNRAPSDRYDPEIAYKLAVGRALQKVANKLIKTASGKVRHNDEVAIAKIIRSVRVAPSQHAAACCCDDHRPTEG